MSLNHKREKLVRKLANKDYRDAWVDESVKMIVPYQIQAIRKQRNWSQEILGKKASMLRNAVSRLESMDYGNLSVNTLLRIAHGLDCGLLVKFVPFSRLVREFKDVSPTALEVNEFDKDLDGLKSWVDSANTSKPIFITADCSLYSNEENKYDKREIKANYCFENISAESSFIM